MSSSASTIDSAMPRCSTTRRSPVRSATRTVSDRRSSVRRSFVTRFADFMFLPLPTYPTYATSSEPRIRCKGKQKVGSQEVVREKVRVLHPRCHCILREVGHPRLAQDVLVD